MSEAARPEHDHSMFDAELSGAMLNMHLLGRIMGWLKPYKRLLGISGVLVLINSTLAVVMEIVISRVLVDYIITGHTQSSMPDLGMIDLTIWLEQVAHLDPIPAAGLLFAILMTIYAITGHLHRMTLIGAIVGGLRDLVEDLVEDVFDAAVA